MLKELDSRFLAYLRGLAAFMIVFGHVGGFWFYRPYSEFLQVFVPIFFFLSGSVLYHSYLKTSSNLLYYKKRFLGIFIPYYLLLLCVLFFYILKNKYIYSLNFFYILKFLVILPDNKYLPFTIGQVWYLNVLVILTLISPFYFRLITNQNKKILYLLCSAIVVLSFVQHFVDIGHTLIFQRFNGFSAYKPIIHSFFFILGAYFFSGVLNNKAFFCSIMLSASLLVYVVLLYCFNVDPDYEKHILAPDLFYVSGSVFSIMTFLIFRKNIVSFIERFYVLKKAFKFLFKHTFSIYLLHTLGIFLSEHFINTISIINYEKNIIFGVLKLMIVTLFTFSFAVPFTAICKKINRFILKNI